MPLDPQQWQQIKSDLRTQVGAEAFESWIDPLDLAASSAQENQVHLHVPTAFIRDWVSRNYGDLLIAQLQAATGRELQVQWKVGVRPEGASSGGGISEKSETTPKISKTTAEALPAGQDKPVGIDAAGTPLNPRFTFETFVTGKSNEFAYAAARRIAEDDSVTYNPFILHGGVGLGKTHLMHAIAWSIRTRKPDSVVLYMSAEKFLYSFVRALRDKSVMAFKDSFRAVDVLMIDDVQFIAGKEATQEEFFHTFNALVDLGKQIVLTADKSPHEMDNLEARLKSRLGMGLASEVHKPDLEMRLAILEKKAAEMGLNLPGDVAMLLADRVSSNVRELEGALNRLHAHTRLVGAPVKVETARDILQDLFRAYDRVVTVEEIQRKVAEFYRIKFADMHGNSRARAVARPRQMAMFLAKKLTTHSYPEIARHFGGRDHTTVMHGIRTIEKLVKDDRKLEEDARILESLLTSN